MRDRSKLTLRVPGDFDLPRAVCSYGYFLLAPNRWDRDAGALYRVLRGRRGRRLTVRVTQRDRAGQPVRIAVDRKVDRDEAASIRRDLVRMLRVDEDQRGWWRVSAAARQRGFGRLFRSPTLWEDMVKTITGQNVTWTNTITMNKLITEHAPRHGPKGAWPTPREMIRFGRDNLRSLCKVGYRADRIVRLAEAFADGSVDPDWFESPDRTTGELYDRLLRIHGFGDYAASNLLMLLGHYDRVAIDTETYRHWCKMHGLDRPADPKTLHGDIERYYNAFAPHQFKAYWFELWQGYEHVFGDARRWDAHTDGPNFTAVTLNRKTANAKTPRRQAAKKK